MLLQMLHSYFLFHFRAEILPATPPVQ